MSRFLKLMFVALGAMLFSGVALACDDCNSGYYGGRAVYSCNEGQYDCRYESALYVPRVGECGYGCHGSYDRYWDNGCGCYRARVRAYQRGYRHGFRDGYETASDDSGFYDDGHKWHRWERWQDGDGHWRDGWHDDKGGWHDRDIHRDGWRDGDHYDDRDWHDGDGHDWHDDGDHGWHDGDRHDGHDGDHHDDHDWHGDHP
ncbi:MAG TPA: hypothetical protein VG867_04250 [Rhizomicrobium sp.]|nr:hypothetical protein [Rhizomicrobium sp.]